MVGINTHRTDCTDAKWSEYCKMSQIHDNETPKNDLLPNKRYFEARKEILLWNGIRRCYDSYVPEI
ncbi:17972_t:CDS:2, partial [Gigaspora margarita]